MKNNTDMVNRVVRRIMAEERDEALEVIDQSVDAMIASIMSIEENISRVKTDTVPQKAAIDTIQELLDEALKPYLSDVVKALEVFSNS